MAQSLNISPRTWQDYEGGVNVPGWKVLEGLARMGFNVNWILTGEEEIKRKTARLTESEAHQAFKDKLKEFKRIQTLQMRMIFEQALCLHEIPEELFNAYVYGDYLPTEEELNKFKKLVGRWDFESGNMATRDEKAEREIEKRIEELSKLQEKYKLINIDLLKEATTNIEEALFSSTIKLNPAKKAELLALVYEEAAKSDENRKAMKEMIPRYLRLAE
jgi:hypothetical protein